MAKKATRRKFLRLVVLADLHCGHMTGLTPESWFLPDTGTDNRTAKRAQAQRQLWNFYTTAVRSLHPIHRVVVNGDAIDGKGFRSGGSELIRADREEQVDMAVECIKVTGAHDIAVTAGTPYHTGKGEDWEHVLAEKLKAEFGGQHFLDIGGVTFDFKHKVGSSSIPHGRMTALARAKLWNKVWAAERQRQPDVDVLVRSHVHYHNYCGGIGWLAMTTPALQGYGSNFGVRQCEGLADIGIVVFDIYKGGVFKWNVISADLPSQRAELVSF